MGLLRREAPASEYIPIVSHVDPYTARTTAGHYVFTIRLAGVSFESADVNDLNNWHERLNVWLRNLASPNLAVWSHVVRRRDHARSRGELPDGFARDLDAKYGRKLAGETLMVNELYVSFVYRPQSSVIGVGAMRVLERADAKTSAIELDESIEQCAKLRGEVLQALDRYDPEALGIYLIDCRRFSSLLEFYGLLVNGEWQRMPLPRADLNHVVATSHHRFGYEAMEYRMPTETRLGAVLGIKEYPTPTAPGMFSPLLSAPFPFVLTQSFAFIAKPTAQGLMEKQQRKMFNTGDKAKSQRSELDDALDDLISNRFVVGDHHFTLTIQAAPFAGVKEAEGKPRLKELNDNIAAARTLLSNTSMVVAREGLAMRSAFWGQLPGNFKYRTRKSPITSRNFAAMSPFHNFPTGRAEGNHWGPALTLFSTASGAPLYFSLHASDPRVADGGSRKDVGHTLGIGPTGGGKTTTIGFLVAQVQKFGASQVIFDKDEGLHILVKALRGAYLPLKNGIDTGCAPFQWEDTPHTIEFWRQLLRVIVSAGSDARLSAGQERDIETGIRGLRAIEGRHERSLKGLVEVLNPKATDGVHAQLLPWCRGGPYGWVLDCPTDRIAPLLTDTALVGFDVTDFLDNAIVRQPLTMCLFHLVQQMTTRHRRGIVWCDEFAKQAGDAAFRSMAKNGLEAWRKKGWSFVPLTQMASHVLGSEIARSILEQTPTKLIWPNPDADYEEYTKGFGLTHREFLLIKEQLEPGSRQFLVKTGRNSTVAKLDLKGFDFELAVISGRTENIALMHEAIAAHGDDPDRWLPAFRAAVLDGAPIRPTHQRGGPCLEPSSSRLR